MRKLISVLVIGASVGMLILSGCSFGNNLNSGQDSDIVVSQGHSVMSDSVEEKLLQNLRDKGFKGFITEKSGGYCLVISRSYTGSYDTRLSEDLTEVFKDLPKDTDVSVYSIESEDFEKYENRYNAGSFKEKDVDTRYCRSFSVKSNGSGRVIIMESKGV